jgi:lysyl-tRNA synthetase class 2
VRRAGDLARNEAHLHAFETELVTTAGERSRLYLHTSPEFAAKRLLAAGETRIFDFAGCSAIASGH